MDFKCQTCQKSFSSKDNLRRHKEANACSIKLNTNSIIGSNAALEVMINKLNTIIRKEVFKLEETNTFDTKDELIDVLCESMATNLKEYFGSKEQVNKSQAKLMDYEKKKNDILENGEDNYKNNIKKINEIEEEIKKYNDLVRIYTYIEKFKTMALTIKISRPFNEALINTITAWEENIFVDFMEDLNDLTMENLDKFHEISGGRTINWLDLEFENLMNEPKEVQELVNASKYYINRRFKDKIDLSNNAEYYKIKIAKKEEMLELLKTENDNLTHEYFLYTDTENKGCGIVLSELCDPQYDNKLQQEKDRNERLKAYKKSIAESADD